MLEHKSSVDMPKYSLEEILSKRRSLRRKLSAFDGLRDIRIAVLGGTTTNELVDFLEILLLESGFRPVFYQSEYGRYYEDAVIEPEIIAAFRPDLVYIHTSFQNIQNLPPVSCNEEDLPRFLNAEFARLQEIWASLERHIGCQVIQNNVDPPPLALLGNLDAVAAGGSHRFVYELNRRIANAASSTPKLIMQDIYGIAARLGLEQWLDAERWFSYKLATSIEGTYAVAASLNAIIGAIYGRSRKVLVLDLDNTLWGGVIGDDGVDKLLLGRETAIAEAYTAFQEYCLRLRDRGVLLAVCSKNDEAIAKSGFSHPDSILKLEHFSSFQANWEPKSDNILRIAQELNLGADSFVFVDDNPAERAIVEAQVPGVAVPNVGSEVVRFASIIDSARYFEAVSLGAEDLSRAALYQENLQRAQMLRKFADYGEYLDSLEMTAEIGEFKPMYMERIAQLTNKTNQFNLTTTRYTLAEIEASAKDGAHIGIYGKLSDRFGDNGLVSVILGRIEQTDLHLDLWLMSCRVLKRGMEIAMLDAICERAKSRGVRQLIGKYIPSAKNQMVSEHYKNLGFSPLPSVDSHATLWSLDVTSYVPLSRHIRIMELAHA